MVSSLCLGKGSILSIVTIIESVYALLCWLSACRGARWKKLTHCHEILSKSVIVHLSKCMRPLLASVMAQESNLEKVYKLRYAISM